MTIKDFFRKIGSCIRSAGRWIRDRALPTVGGITKPILGMFGVLPGKIGMIGKIGSGIADVLHQGISKIPNENVRDKLNGVVARGNETVKRVVDWVKDGVNRVNAGIGVVKDVVESVKHGINNQVKLAVLPKIIKPL